MTQPEEAPELSDTEIELQNRELALRRALDTLGTSEAGISTTMHMVNEKDGRKIQITLRWPLLAEWEAYDKHVSDYLTAKAKVGWRIVSDALPQAKPQPVSTDAAEATGKGPSPKPSPSKHTPVTNGGTQGGKPMQVFKADSVVIEPKPDGKVRVNFWQTGRKYADLYGTKTAEKWAELFGWGVDAFESAETYAARVEVGYTLSDKTNDKGNPYKDIEYVKEL